MFGLDDGREIDPDKRVGLIGAIGRAVDPDGLARRLRLHGGRRPVIALVKTPVLLIAALGMLMFLYSRYVFLIIVGAYVAHGIIWYIFSKLRPHQKPAIEAG